VIESQDRAGGCDFLQEGQRIEDAVRPIFTSKIKVLRRPVESAQYASDAYRRLIGDYKMVQSMSRKGNCWDNGAMESFFKSLKVERVYQTRY
jgi:transposase InsO family protein